MNQDVESFYRKVREKRHRPTGTVIYDVTWGAKDRSGNPKYPGNGDGHGHRIYLLLNGEELTLFERQPDPENMEKTTKELDEQEWEEALSSPVLKEIEEIRKVKSSLVKRAEACARQGEAEGGKTSLEELKKSFGSLKSFGLEWEEELSRRLDHAREQFEARKDERAKHKSEKEELIREVAAFVEQGTFKNSDEVLKDQMERWKKIGSAGAAEDDALWEVFHGHRQEFYRKRKEYYDSQREKHLQNLEKKKELIEAARETVEGVTSFKDASLRMNEIFDRWKETGSAGRNTDEKLWAEFNEVRTAFKEKRKAFYDGRQGDREAAAKKKAELLERAKQISASHEYSKENSEIMKQLNVEWKEAGSAGHETDEKLWEEYRKAQDEFWEGKHEEHAAARKEYTDKLESTIEKKQTQIENLQNQIYHLKDKMHAVQNPGYLINMEGWVQEKEAAIRELKEQIERMNKRL